MSQTVSTPVSGQEGTPWGTLAAIDLHGCACGPLVYPDRIRAFVPALIEAIGMRAHGPLALERFGNGELEGWSAMQFVETSTITVQADEVGGRLFVDVFSCRPFRPRARGVRGRRALRRRPNLEGDSALTDAAPVLGVLAGVVGVADVVPYVPDTARRSTCPHRGTWLIWSVSRSLYACPSEPTVPPGA